MGLVVETGSGRATVRRQISVVTDSVAAGANFSIQISNDVRAFADVWPSLAEIGDRPQVRSHPFQCRDHLEIWQETIGASCNVQPLFVHVSRRGAPLMMLPLGIRTRAGLRMLTFLDEGVADYNAPVLYRIGAEMTPRDVMAFWDTLSRAVPHFDVAVLDKIPLTVGDFRNPLAEIARNRCPMSGHFFPLDGGSPEETPQSSHEAKDNRRCRRRLSELGPLTFNIATCDSEVMKVFDTFVRQKLERFHETLGLREFDVPGQHHYYRTLTQRLLGHGVHLTWLAVGDEVVATAWCLSSGRRFYYMMCGYEARDPWRKFSPGRLLLEELVNWARQGGFAEFDLGIGDEDYKFRWRQTTMELYSALLPRTLRGRAYCNLLEWQTAVKHHLPPGVVQTIKRALGRTKLPTWF